MAEQFYTILTKIGKAKIANTSALGSKLNLAKFQVGDSNGSYYNPTEEQTELKHKVWEGPISSITIDENNPNWIVLQTMLPGDIGGFMIREAGVFDDEGNLIAIGKYPETYKPVTSEGSSKDLVIKMILEVSNASSVTLKIDPTVILATKKDIEILENKIKNIKIPVTSVNKKTGDIELKAEDIKCNDGKTVETSLDDKVSKLDFDKLGEFKNICTLLNAKFDLNTLDKNGNYMGYNLVNAPSSEWFYIKNLKHATTHSYQKAIPVAPTFINSKATYERWKEGGVWTPWFSLFQFVSDGKGKVTSATTDMGVPTSPDATFDTIASNIRKLSSLPSWVKGNGAWIVGADMPTSRWATTCELYNDRIYVFGGIRTGGNDSKSVEVYNPINNTWEIKNDMPYTTSNFGTNTKIGNNIYVLGLTDTSDSDGFFIYNPEQQSWVKKASPMVKRTRVKLTNCQNEIYAIGGATYISGSKTSAVVEKYNISLNTWSQVKSMNIPRQNFSVATVDNNIYAIGGISYGTVQSSVEKYDPLTNTWTNVNSMTASSDSFSTAVIGKVIYKIGGGNVEMYDTLTNTWTVKKNLPISTSDTASINFNKNIYTFGGYSAGNSVQCYIPS